MEGTFFIGSLKIKSEAEFLISSGTFFQSWLPLYAILSRPNFFVLGFCVEISEVIGILSELKDSVHDVRR